jgi:VIT1/CCC1 family predicted Fe2+/Mn2+ transporter
MAAGEYNSMRVQSELLARELRLEAQELERRPQHEAAELTRAYEARGLSPTQAHDVAAALMRDPASALEAHAREELGIDPHNLGSPWRAAASSFGAFAVGALVPLVPWFVAAGAAATVASLALGVLAALVVGALVARSTGRPAGRAMARQALFTIVPAGVTYAIGTALGVGVT